MEKVIKKALGYFKPKENEDYTHVILTEKEYNKNERKILDLENGIKKLEREYNSAIERYKKSANDKIAEIRTDADERIAEAHAETEEYKNRADSFENINRNLIRVATERANVKRGLIPKKQHSGYICLSVEEYTFNCECEHPTKSSRTLIIKLPCFQIRLQSPYNIAFDLESVKDLIHNDITNRLGAEMNIGTVYGDFTSYDENEVRKIWSNAENFMFKIKHKANFQKGFWEVEYLTRFMPVIPQSMIASQ